MENEHAEENLLFIEEIENLKLTETVHYKDAPQDIDFYEKFANIMRKYIVPGSEHEVNLPQPLVKHLMNMTNQEFLHIDRNKITMEIEKAEKQVLEILMGIFPRFQNSLQFQLYLQPNTSKRSFRAAYDSVSRRISSVTSASTILLCEEHTITRLVISRMLSRHGYIVDMATNGVEALEKLNEQVFKIVLVSYELSRVDVHELIRIHKMYPQAINVKSKFICMVFTANRYLKKALLRAGYSATLLKPFSMDDFEQTLLTSGNQWSKFTKGIKSLLQ